MRYYLAALVAIVAFGVPWVAVNHPLELSAIAEMIVDAGSGLAAVVTHNPRTILALQDKYNDSVRWGGPRVRVLIVPGHEPDYGGAEYADIKERNLVVPLADHLAQLLRDDGHYDVFVTRDTKAWNPTFFSYFGDHWDEIIDWQKSYRQEMSRLISVGSVSAPESKVYHNTAPNGVAYRLYGITKWANENTIDITIHVHLNDYPGHGSKTPGKYSGFAIYVPSAQYLNSTTTKAVADSIFKRLSQHNRVSNLKGESGGIIDEPQLIAVGAHNTADAASMLIEYGYLYEPQFTDPKLRDGSLKELARQTYLGLNDFFSSRPLSVNNTNAVPALFRSLLGQP